MKIDIKARHTPVSSQLKSRIKQRASFVFSRLEHAVSSIMVTVSDVNGPKGGEDKLCKVIVKSSGLPTIVISDNKSSIPHAVDSALSRAGHRLQQSMNRRRTRISRRISLQNLPSVDEGIQT